MDRGTVGAVVRMFLVPVFFKVLLGFEEENAMNPSIVVQSVSPSGLK